jgi:hypothetical protein
LYLVVKTDKTRDKLERMGMMELLGEDKVVTYRTDALEMAAKDWEVMSLAKTVTSPTESLSAL